MSQRVGAKRRPMTGSTTFGTIASENPGFRSAHPGYACFGEFLDRVPSERRAAKIRKKSSQLPKQDATLAIYDDPGVPGN